MLYVVCTFCIYVYAVNTYVAHGCNLGLYAVHVINHAVLHCRIHHILATRMTAIHGSLAAFNSNTEEWTEYIERLEFYFAANGITDGAKQRAILLSCCGPSMFRLMRTTHSTYRLYGQGISGENESPPRTQAVSDCSMLPVQFAPTSNERNSGRICRRTSQTG